MDQGHGVHLYPVKEQSPPAEADRHPFHKLLINGFESKEHCKISGKSKESSHVTTQTSFMTILPLICGVSWLHGIVAT